MFGLFGSGDIELASDGELFTQLRQLITKAEEDVLLVAPYVDPNDDLVRVLKDATRRVSVEIWFREDKATEYRAAAWFHDLTAAGVSFRAIKNLHAKLYAIDDSCIVSSMNLTKASWNNSREFGCIVSLDSKHGDRIIQYIDALGEESTVVGSPRQKEAKRHWNRSTRARPVEPRTSQGGFCIRCSTSIPFSPERPYCKADYEKWAEYKNPDFKDKYCHKCGAPSAATLKRPLCRACFDRGE
ncbi:MAG: phospholipase D family protein [Myxococcales bacterium]|nr:phospholipase D family protein [Myxococcales bacterium]